MKLKPVALRLATSLLASAVALAAAEAVTRRTYGEGFKMLVDPHEEHIYRPFLEYEQVNAGRTIRFYTNSLGWKDERPGRRVAKRPPGPRIVFLGDSFAEGLGIAQRDSVSGIVQRELQRQIDPAGGRIEVLNGGRTSFCPMLEYQRLKRFLEAGYRADTLVVLHDVSDVQDELSYGSRYLFGEDGEPLRLSGWKNHPVLRGLYNRSALVRSLVRLPKQLDAAAGTGEARPGDPVARQPAQLPPGFFASKEPLSAGELMALPPLAYNVLRANWMGHPPSLAGWAGEGLRSSAGNLLRIKRLADQHGMRLLVVIYPWPQMLWDGRDPDQYEVLAHHFGRWFAEREAIYGRAPSPRVSAYQQWMHRLCAENGIALLDLIPDFQRVPDWQRLYLRDDVHFNELGHRLAGQRIAQVLGRP